MERRKGWHKVKIWGKDRLILVEKNLEYPSLHRFIPKKAHDIGYGVSCDTWESAIQHMKQADCTHNIQVNPAKQTMPNLTPMPFKCINCNRGFMVQNPK